MIGDLDDFIIKKIGLRQDKFYRMECTSCGADRGYLLKYQDKRSNCNKCSKVGRKPSEQTKQKMSVAAKNNKNASLKYRSQLVDTPRVDGRLIRDKSTYVGPKRFLTDEQRRIKSSMRTLLWQKLKNRGITRKTNKTFNLLGYSPEVLIKHLESKFQVGMAWNNYGPIWHIDHMIPDSWFNYCSTEDEQFKKSWSLDNLQPLWKKENHSKGNRYSH